MLIVFDNLDFKDILEEREIIKYQSASVQGTLFRREIHKKMQSLSSKAYHLVVEADYGTKYEDNTKMTVRL